MTAEIRGYMYSQPGFGEQMIRFYPRLENLRVYVEPEFLEEEGVVEVEFNFTTEGLIVDLTDMNGNNAGTASFTYDELLETLLFEEFSND